MSYRKILVSVHAGDGARNAVETAFALARMFDAHVDGLHVRIEPADAVPYVGDGMSGALVQELVELTEREGAERATAARELFESLRRAADLPSTDAPGTHGPSVSWLEEAGREADAVVHAGHLADLIVVGRPGPDEVASASLVSSVLFGSGRPVLVAGDDDAGAHPAGALATGTPGRVVIAWKPCAEAARAVAAALPLLARATQVTLVGAGDGEDTAGGLERLAHYLAWHGIACAPAQLESATAVGEALAAVGRTADLVVMGAYSHGRLREMILGGVTRHMLEKTALPLLLAH